MKSTRLNQFYLVLAFYLVFILPFQNCAPPISFKQIEAGQQFELSSVAPGQIFLDGQRPYTNKNQVVVDISAPSNITEVYLTTDASCSGSGKWQALTDKALWTFNEKNKVLSLYAKFRNKELTESSCVSDSIVHDDIPPVLSLAGLIVPRNNSATTDIKINSLENGSGLDLLSCSTNVPKCDYSVSIQNSADGLKTYTFSVLDKAGNKSNTLNVSWTTDRTPPQLNILAKPSTKTSALSFEFSFEAIDAYSTANTFSCKLDAGLMAPCQSKQLINFAAGDHRLEVFASDDLGNRSASQFVDWTVVRNLPVVKFTKKPEPYINTTANFEFSAEDQFLRTVTNFECRLDTGAWISCSSPLSYSVQQQSEAPHVLRVRATDLDGLVSGEELVNWTFDKTPPVLNWIIAPKSPSNLEFQTISVSATDAIPISFVEFKVSGTVVSNSLSQSILHKFSEGTSTIEVRAQDRAGNTSGSLTHQFVLDQSLPTITLVSNLGPNITVENFNRVVLSGACSENGRQVQLYFGTTNLANLNCATGTYSLPLNMQLIPYNQSVEIEARTDDAAGNKAVPAKIILFKVKPSMQLSYSVNPFSILRTLAVSIPAPSVVNPTGQPVQSWSVSPQLPAGLFFNTSTGTITGTVSMLYHQKKFTVSATSTDGIQGSTQLELLDISENTPTIDWSAVSNSFPPAPDSYAVAKSGKVFMVAADSKDAIVTCFDKIPATTEKITILNSGRQTEFITVVTNDTGSRALVLARQYKIPGDLNSRTYSAWYLDASCNILSGPTEYYGPTEYFSIDMDKNGNGVTAVVTQIGLPRKANISYYNTSGQVTWTKDIPLVYGTTAYLNHKIIIKFNPAGTLFYFSAQGYGWDPIAYKKFTKVSDTTINETEYSLVPTICPGALDKCKSGYYQTHSMGVNDKDDLLFVWHYEAEQSYNGVFIGADGIAKKIVQFEKYANPRNYYYDTFRDYNGRQFKISNHGSNFLIPTNWKDFGNGYNYVSGISVYTGDGNFIKSVSTTYPHFAVEFDSREIFVDGFGNYYISDKGSFRLYKFPLN